MTNTHMSPSRSGDFAEYYAVTWLWDQGYTLRTLIHRAQSTTDAEKAFDFYSHGGMTP